MSQIQLYLLSLHVLLEKNFDFNLKFSILNESNSIVYTVIKVVKIYNSLNSKS